MADTSTMSCFRMATFIAISIPLFTSIPSSAQSALQYNDSDNPVQLTCTMLWDPNSPDLEDWQYFGRNVPGLIACESGELLIADRQNTRVIHFKTSGELIQVIGCEGEGPGEFREITGIAYDKTSKKLWIMQNRDAQLSIFRRTDSGFEFDSCKISMNFASSTLALEDSATFWTKVNYRTQRINDPAYADLIHLLDACGNRFRSFGSYWLDYGSEIQNDFQANRGMVVSTGQGLVAFVWEYRPRIEVWKSNGEMLVHREFETGDVARNQVRRVHPDFGEVTSAFFDDATCCNETGLLFIGFGVSGMMRYDIYGLDPETLSIEEWYQFHLPGEPLLAVDYMVPSMENGQRLFYCLEGMTSGVMILRAEDRN
ncbi:6-bladed beta-propeller [Gemmatimonadota bacterium]